MTVLGRVGCATITTTAHGQIGKWIWVETYMTLGIGVQERYEEEEREKKKKKSFRAI